MKSTLSLEYIGEAQYARLSLYSKMIDHVSVGLGNQVIGKIESRKPWIAEITGSDPKYGFKRAFLKGNWQRKRSNSTGSRGVEIWFNLESGRLYEVKSHTSWKATDRFFCVVSEAGNINRLTAMEAKEWLKDH